MTTIGTVSPGTLPSTRVVCHSGTRGLCDGSQWPPAQREPTTATSVSAKQRHVYLYSRPRCLGLVLGNACNIDCIHCYQARNGSNLLRPPEIAAELRRELMAFYPYASTLRIQGGEVFAIRGFRDLIDDVAQLVRRPILSISTN